MKQLVRFFFMLVCILSIWQAKAQVPGTYVTVPSGNQTLTNDSIKGIEKWYKWPASAAQIGIQIQMTQQGVPYQMAQVELFRDSSGTLIHLWADTLHSNGSMRLNAYNLATGTDLYVHFINYNNGCTSCTITNALATLNFQTLAIACGAYIQPPCQFVKDGGFEYSTGGCGPPTMFTNPCNANCITWFADCFWTLPIPTSFVNCPSGIQNPFMGSPDYYNECGTPNGAHTGNGYAGAFFYSSTTNTAGVVVEDTYREYITEKLANPMLPGRKYRVTMWVRHNRTDYSVCTQNIQIAFTSNQLTQTGTTIISSPGGQVQTMANDTIEQSIWLPLTQTVTATGTYSYATIGNFAALGASNAYDDNPVNGLATYSHAYYYIDDVSIVPLDTAMVSPNPVSLCQGASVTFTAAIQNNGFPVPPISFTWLPASPDPSLTYGNTDHSLATITPTASNVYSITALDAYGCFTHTVAVVTFTTPPNVTVIPNPMTICATNTLALSASGADTYSWSTGANTNSIVVAPSASTVYTVTGFRPNCPNSTQTATVNVINPAPVTVSGPTGTLCPGQNYTLTASGASSYTWSTGQNGSSIVVSPTVSTTYTVYATNPSCTGPLSATISLNVLPYPQNLAIGGNNTICLGNSTSLTASISNTNAAQYHYTWQPGGATSANVTVSPTVTTVYTVTVSDNLGCGLSAVAYFQVKVNSPLNIVATASPNPICSGQKTVLTATGGGSSYFWLPANQLGNNITVSPTTTTTYSAQINVPGCGISQGVVTVSVVTAGNFSLSAVPSNQYPCLGTSVTFSAIPNPVGTYTYTWLAPIAQNGQTATYTPTDNVVYTVQAKDVCGSTKSSSVCVSVVSNLCCVPNAESLTNATINNGSQYANLYGVSVNIYGTLTINANVTWTACDMKMRQGAKIIIKPGARLTLDKTHLFSCADIWEGIIIQTNGTQNGRISVQNSSTIEDAYRAIYYDGLNTPLPNNFIDIQNSTFNKNYIAVSLNNCAQNGSSNNTFESSVYHTYLSGTSPGNNLKCSSFYTPVIKARGYIGYQLTDEKTEIFLGSVTTSFSGISNLFDRLDYGYYGTNSLARLSYDEFDNITGSNVLTAGVLPVGIGIYSTANNTSISPFYSNSVNNCIFRNVWRCVETNNIGRVEVGASTMTNPTTSGLTCSGGCVGNAGVITTNTRVDMKVTNNIIQNYNTGIQVQFNTVVTSPTFSCGIGQNTITATTAGSCRQAIQVMDAVNNFSVTGARIIIANNLTNGVQNGIYSNNIKNGLRASNNTVNFIATPATLQTGIRLNGTENAWVDNNTITGGGTSNAAIKGIWMQLSPGSKVQCNAVSNVGQCVVYEGNNTSAINGFLNNSMTTAQDGLVLKNNGVIGQQGFNLFGFNIVSGNTWATASGSFSNFKTFTDVQSGAASSAQNSKLYVRNTATDNPYLIGSISQNQTNGTSFLDNYFTGGTNQTLVATSLGFPFVCPTPLQVAQKVIPQQPIATLAQTFIQNQTLNNLISNSANYVVRNGQTKFIHKDYVYDLLNQGQVLSPDTGLTNFYANNVNTGHGDYAQVDSLIQKQQYSQALSKNSSSSTSSNIEQNKRDMNQQLLNRMLNANYSYSANDMTFLYTLAAKCPLEDGNAVYQARSLLNVILDQSIDFIDSCDAGGKTSVARIAQHDGNGNEYLEQFPDNFILFPNPNNGEMQILYSLHDSKLANIAIYDMTGKQVYMKGLTKDSNLMQISIDGLPAGVYYYTVKGDGSKILKTDKLIIIK
ncbi:MAG: T9SS type A sorting domain-containing protein [Bacteroidetes bacterium]|nr:T9SS type A sorting domain-containing protein [Bacteroidota bacterium]